MPDNLYTKWRKEVRARNWPAVHITGDRGVVLAIVPTSRVLPPPDDWYDRPRRSFLEIVRGL